MKQTTQQKYAEIVDSLFKRIAELRSMDISSAQKKLEEIERKWISETVSAIKKKG